MPEDPKNAPDPDEIDRRVRKLLGEDGEEEPDEPAPPKPTVHDEFQARLEEMEARAKQVKESAEKRAEPTSSPIIGQDMAQRTGIGLQIGYVVIGFPITGFAIGYYIDRSQHTEIAKGICVLIGATIGVTLAIVMATKAVK